MVACRYIFVEISRKEWVENQLRGCEAANNTQAYEDGAVVRRVKLPIVERRMPCYFFYQPKLCVPPLELYVYKPPNKDCLYTVPCAYPVNNSDPDSFTMFSSALYKRGFFFYTHEMNYKWASLSEQLTGHTMQCDTSKLMLFSSKDCGYCNSPTHPCKPVQPLPESNWIVMTGDEKPAPRAEQLSSVYLPT